MSNNNINELNTNPILSYNLKIKISKFHERYKKIPDCFEKSLIKFLLVFGVKAYKTINELQHFSEISPSDIEKECKFMKERIEIEELTFVNINSINTIANIFESKDWDAGMNFILEIHNNYQVLDIDKMREINEINNSEAISIKDQDIVLVLGPTGCGKSTTIHFLMGSEMEETKVSDMTHIQPIRNSEDPSILDKVTTSPYPTSETNSILAIKLKKSNKKNENNILYLCDTPGFADTNGCEVDIVNGIGVVEAVKTTKSVRFLVVVSYFEANSTRMRGLASLSHILSNLINNIENCEGYFQFVFTHFPNEQSKADLRNKVNYLLELEEKANDKSFIFLLKQMMNNILQSDEDGSDNFINPTLNKNRQSIIKRIFDGPALENPRKHFNCSFDNNSKSKLTEQVQRHQMVISACSSVQDYPLIRLKLNELRFLKNILQDLPFLQQTFDECITILKKSTEKNYNGVIQGLLDCIQNSNTIQDKFINAFKQQREYAQNITDELNKEFNLEGIKTSKQFTEILTNIGKDLIEQSMSKEFDDDTQKTILKKLKELSNNFNEIEYNVDHIYVKLKLYQESFKDSLENNDFKKCAKILKIFEQTKLYLCKLLDSDKLEQAYTNIKVHLDKYLQHLRDEIEAILKNNIINTNDYVTLKTNMKNLSLGKSDIVEFKEFYEECISKMKDHFENMQNSIQELIPNTTKSETLNGKKNIEGINTFLQRMSLLIDTSNDSNEKAIYNNFFIFSLRNVYSFMNELRHGIVTDVENITEKLTENTSDAYKRLTDRFKCLEEIKWIDNYKLENNRNITYESIKSSVKNTLLKEIKRLKHIVENLNFAIENPNDIVKANEAINKMSEIGRLGEFIEEISEEIKNTKNDAQSKTNAFFKYIDEISDNKGEGDTFDYIDLDHIEKAFKYIGVCNSANFVVDHKNIIVIKSKLEKYIKTYKSFLEKQINSSFTKIDSEEDEHIKQLDDIIEKLYDSLSKLRDLKHYELTSQCFDPQIANNKDNLNLLTYAIKKLRTLFDNFDEEMRKEMLIKDRHRILKRLEKIRTLRLMDEFLENNPFTNLYKETWKNLIEKAEEVIESFEKNLNNNEYKQARRIISDLEKSQDVISKDYFNQCKDILKRTVITKINDTKHSLTKYFYNDDNDDENEQIKSITANFTSMNQIQFQLKTYIELDTSESLDERKQTLIKRFEERFIERMDKVSKYLKTDNYADAAKFMKTLKQNIDTMDSHYSENLLNKRKDAENEFKTSLEDLENKFKQKEIDEYLYDSPKELFDKLGNSYLFKDTINKLEKIIVDKYRKKMNNILSSSKNTNFDGLENNDIPGITLDSFRELKQIERTITLECLPKKIFDILKTDLKDLKDEIERNIEIQNLKIDEGINKQNLKMIGYYYKLNNNRENKEKILKFLNTTIARYCEEITKIINISKKTDSINNEFCDKLEKLFACINFGDSYNIEFNSECLNSFILTLRCTIETLINSLETHFTSNNNENSIDSNLYENFNFLNLYNSLKITASNDIKLPEFLNSFNHLIDTIIDSILLTQTEFNTTIENWNVQVLKDVLNKINIWDKIINEIKIKNLHVNSKKYHNLELLDYSSMKTSLINKIMELKKELIDTQLITDNTKSSEYLRNLYHNDIKKKFEKLQSVNEFNSHIGSSLNITSFQSEINETLVKNCEIIIFELEAKIIDLENGNINDAVCKAIYINFSHIDSLKERFYFIKDRISERIKSVEQYIFKVVNRIVDAITKRSTTTDVVAEKLIEMKIISDNIQIFKKNIDDKIDETLKYYKSNSPPNEISKLGTILNGSHVGKIIINEHSIFEGFAFALFSKKVAPQTITYVLDNLDGDDLNKETLKNCYDEYHAEYKCLLDLHLKKNVDFDKIKRELNNYLDKSKRLGMWNTNITNLIPKTLAYICLIWTLKKSSLYFEADELDDKEFYLRRPHPVQIIAIFRLLSVADKNQSLKNSLCEIGTGEGKSIVLAVLASIFAVFGFDVSCVCYSKYLSERDYNEFHNLFETLDVDKFIKYDTFNEICEDIINEKGSLRNQIKDLINGLNLKQKTTVTQRPKILLIDEVDVFLKNDFYGNLYKPTTLLSYSVKPLIEYIWKNRKSNLNLEIVKSTPQYQETANHYKGWEFLIEESVKNLIFDVKTFDQPKYVVKDDAIGYIEHDSISFKTVYGYKTLFAYFSEHEKGKISSTSLDNNVYLQVKCGNFSYSEIPFKFKCIIGVTGTLQHLTEPEKHIIEIEYEINNKTYLPSVFGYNQLQFDRKTDVHIVNINGYYEKIISEITSKLNGKNPETKRAVLVFFESIDSLMKLYNCDEFLSMRHLAKILTEEDNLTSKEKDHFIKEATRSGAISLLTRSFGRGSNFICRDDIVITNGGVHVIQTFLSEQYSEEVQIRGRTARHGDTGSFSMILLEQDLEKFSISMQDIEINEVNIYEFIHEKRNAYFVKHYNSDKDFKTFIKSEHEKSLKFLESLKSNKMEFVKNYLKTINKGIENTLHSKTLCLIDATGSMGDLLIQTKNKVYEMFNDAIKILEESKMNPNCFQLQFAVYRDYDCGVDEILQVSPWVTKPDDLYDFLSKIKPHGGEDYEEAIEIGLQHANLEFEKNEITQVLLIGDAPAKQYTEVQNYRNDYGGEKVWTKSFGSATHYKEEATKLRDKNIPVYTFYLKDGAKSNFEEIANMTNGKCEFLDVSKANTKQSLSYLVTRQLLANIGESCGKGNKFAEQYMQYFTKAYK